MPLQPYEYIHFFGNETIQEIADNIRKKVNEQNGVFVLQYPHCYLEFGIGLNFKKVGNTEFQKRIANRLKDKYRIFSEHPKDKNGKEIQGIWIFYLKNAPLKFINKGREEAAEIAEDRVYD